ncbi:MAG: amidophosphoribosyltransferase [Coriobacteriaceae bacterium]|nr:amidophosphoribosyltransferase [Coriobacteriaceae bacterium]
MSHDAILSESTAFDLNADKPHEECGIFGVWAPDRDVARLTYFGLRALQHRGQESAGIAVGDGGTVMVRKDLGLVSHVFSDADICSLPGQLAVGHVRYGTAGAKSWEASQPHLSTINDVIVALAHNGTLVNTDELRRQLIELGVPFNSNSDSEVAVKLIGYFTQETHHLREGIRKTMELIRGGYAMTLINENALYAFRDPHGVRPLVLGRLTSDEGVAAADAAAAAAALPSDAASAEDLVGDEVAVSAAGWVVASETCALDIIGAEYVRDIRPGEILRISAEGLVSEQGVPAAEKTAHCIFEQVYFARPDSIVDGKSIYACRYDMGRKLALECPVEADMVIGTPDSGLPSAEGYAFESGIPYGTGLIKNRYVARTFIEPTQELRAMGVRLKLNPLRDVIEGKRIVVVDDSIVRGTTMVQLVRMLRQAGAKEIHIRINCPEDIWPCFYGVDTGEQSQLISATKSVEEVCEFIGADTLAFLSVDALLECVPKAGYCTACFTGEYPVAIPDSFGRDKFIEGYQPRGVVRTAPVTKDVIEEKYHDHSWEESHEA